MIKYFLKLFKIQLILVIFATGEVMSSNLPKYYTKTLENGLQMVVIPLKNGSDVVSTDVFYKVGSRNEIMGKSGIAHMLEHLNFKSTKNLKAGEFDEIVKGFGGVNNASTSFDYTHYYIKSSSKNTNQSLKLFADIMENLTLKDEEFQPERNVVAEERRWRTDNNPMGYLQFRLFNNAYIYHPYHWTPIGFMNDIQNWDIKDIKEFHSTYYQPKNAIVIVAGDIDENQAFKLIENNFKKIKNKKEIPRTIHMQEPEQDGAKKIFIHKKTSIEMIAVAFHIPNFEHEDQPALNALSELLSNGKSSILQRKLVDEKRLVNSIYAYSMDLKDPGLFMFVAVANEGVDALKIEKEIFDTISKVKQGKFKEKDIDKIKINTKAEFIFSLDNSSEVASLYGSYLARGNIHPLLDYEKNVENLTKQNLIDVANKYFTLKNSTTIILKDE